MATTDTDNAAPETASNTQDVESNSKNDKKKSKEKKLSTKKDEIIINPDMPSDTAVTEAVDKTIVLAWGRMNPPTIGHEKLVKKVKDIARSVNGIPHIMLTHSQDAKKNPLEYKDKIRLARQAFGNIVHGPSPERTLIDVLKTHQKMGNKIIMVAGSDRVKEYETLLNKYNGKDYNYDSIEVVSAGERDPDADGAQGMSASKMREAASKGDIRSFTSGLPSKIKNQAKLVMDLVRAGMKLAEELEEAGIMNLEERVLDLTQRRKRALVMRRYKAKIARARAIARKRMAKEKNLRLRAQKLARKIVRKRVAGDRGANYEKLPATDKMAIDRLVDKKGSLVARLAKRLLPRVKQAEIKRLVKARQNKAGDGHGQMKHIQAGFEPEYIDILIESMYEYEINDVFEALWEQETSAGTKARIEADKEDDAVEDSNTLADRVKPTPNNRKLKHTKTFASESVDIDLDYIQSLFETAENRLIEGAVSSTKERHKQEIERIKVKHDREMDRARVADARTKARETNPVKEETMQIKSLVKKSESSGIPYSILEQVYNRGLNSFTGNAVKQTAEQFAFARVNSYINKGKTYYTEDKDLHEMEIDPNLQHRITAAKNRLAEQLKQEQVKLREGNDNIRVLARMADIKHRLETVEEEYKSYDPNKIADLFFEASKEEFQKRDKLRRLAKLGLVEPDEYAKFDIIMNKMARIDGDTDKLTHKERGFLSKIYDKLTDVIAADPTVFQKYRSTLSKMSQK